MRLSLPLAMSTPPNNEKSPRKWFKHKLRLVLPSKSPSRNLDVPDADALPISTNVPPINASFLAAQENSPSDGPRIIPDHTGISESVSFIIKGFEHNFDEGHTSLSDVKSSQFTGFSTPMNVTTSASTSLLTLWLTMKDINSTL